MFGRVWNMISAMEIYVCDKKAEIDRQMQGMYKRIKASEGEKNDKTALRIPDAILLNLFPGLKQRR